MRGSISAEIDGELSEFESILLQGHLDRCDSCRMFKADAERLATALRTAPVEPLSKPITVPSRRRRVLPLRMPAAVSAAAVLMIAFGGVFESLHSGSAIRAPRAPAAAFDRRQDYGAMLRRQLAANYAQLSLRRAQTRASQIPHHPGFQP